MAFFFAGNTVFHALVKQCGVKNILSGPISVPDEARKKHHATVGINCVGSTDIHSGHRRVGCKWKRRSLYGLKGVGNGSD